MSTALAQLAELVGAALAIVGILVEGFRAGWAVAA